MDLEGILLNEISQSEKNKYRMISLISGILKKINEQTKQNRNRLIDRTNRWLPEGMREEGEG